MSLPYKHVVLTGLPGIGKTTLIKQCIDLLKEKNILVNGFYTEEVRVGGKRIGFDVVTVDSQRAMLARIESDDSHTKRSQPMVGQYTVKIKEFETHALPSISKKIEEKHLLVIDEIGKMELFSPSFIRTVRSVIQSGNSTVFATIPVARGKPIPFVEEIRNHKDVKVFEITRENRDTVKEDILQTLLKLCT